MVRADLEKLKLLIEKIEMIPNDNLGIILSQNNMGHYGLHLYSDSRESVGVENLEILIRIFRGLSELNFHTEYENECAGRASTKRGLLDFLNSNYLTLKGTNELNWLVMGLDYIYMKNEWKPTELDQLYSIKEEKAEDWYLDRSVKVSLFRLLKFKEYEKLVTVRESDKAKKELIANLIYTEAAKDYDFVLFSKFKENFKPMRSMGSNR